MSIIAGYDTAHAFRLNGLTLPPGATFTAQARQSLRGHPRGMTGGVLATLTTAGGDILLTDDAGAPVLTLIFRGATTDTWDVEEITVDVVRTDVSPPSYLGFKALIRVTYPATVLP